MPDDPEDRVRRFVSAPVCWRPSLSPDGSRLAFISNLSGQFQAWTVAADGGWPAPVTAMDEAVMGLAWSPDGRWLLLVVAPGGGNNTQVHVVRPDGSGLRRLTSGGSETNTATGWSPQGLVMMATNERTRSGMDALLVDPETGESTPVADLGGVGGIGDVSPDGRHALVVRVRQRGDADVVAVDLVGGQEIGLTPHTGPAVNACPRFSAGGWVYLVTSMGRERAALGRLRFADALAGRPAPVEIVAERSDAELDDLAVDGERRTGVLTWNVGGRSELELVDLESGASRPGPTPPAEVVASVSLSRDGSRLAIAAGGPASPPNIWTWDAGDERLVQATHGAPPGIDLGTLIRPELVRFPAHDGLELSGWLFRASRAAGPLVIQFHGGPEAQARPVWSPLTASLLEAGISMFVPNVRGSSGFGKTFVNLDNGALRFGAIRDIEACARYVLDNGIARPGQLGIMGGSYGGYMTIAGITEYPDLFDAACDICGVVNFETFFAHTQPWMAAISKVEYGDPETEAELLRSLSPIHRIDRARTPTLVVHGANDTNVPVVEAEQVVENLRRRDVPVDYLLFPDEGHGVTKTENLQTMTQAIVRWFQQYLCSAPE
jgi:dipeptidyl aminopeptidase/acylaminoacyl peptidase